MKPEEIMREDFWSPFALLFIPEGYTKNLASMNNDELRARRVKKSIAQSAERQFVRWLHEQHNKP